ncbi:MAG: hypothetical protein WKG00_36665 [Polyangiaceae bacterium]
MRSYSMSVGAMVAVVPALLWSAGCSNEDDPDHPTGTPSSSSGASSSTGGSGAQGGGGSGTGASGGGGAGSGGAPVVEGTDTCPGASVTLAPGEAVKGGGTTTGAIDDYTTFCGDTQAGMDAGDVVFQVTTSAPGTFRAVLDDVGAFDGVVSIRRDTCEARAPNDECVNLGTDGEDYTTDLAAGTYWVVVDGANATAGDFTLDMSLAAAVCGDGVVNESTGEECDPVTSDDTCFPPGDPEECTFQPPPVASLQTCPGYEVAIAGDQSLVLGPFNNGTYNDDQVGSCAGDVGGRDNVFQFAPSESGLMTVVLGNDAANGQPWCDTCGNDACTDGDGCWAFTLYAREGACDGGSAVELDCAFDPTFVEKTATVEFPVTGGSTYWVIVDSTYDGPFTAGPYYLEASLDTTP